MDYPKMCWYKNDSSFLTGCIHLQTGPVCESVVPDQHGPALLNSGNPWGNRPL